MDNSLREGVSESLLRAGELKPEFDQVRDPYIKLQLEDMKKTEAQRREEGGAGSEMIKRHKPFPELRPSHYIPQIRDSFDSAWFQERLTAHLKHCMAEAASKVARDISRNEIKLPARKLER